MRNRLSDLACRTSRPGTRLADGGNLYLVTTHSSRLWHMRYRISGRENIYAIGRYPAITLHEARRLRDEAAKLVAQGIHPAAQRKLDRLAQGETLTAVAHVWLEAGRPHWSKSYDKLATRILQKDVLPEVGPLPARSVTSAHLLTTLKRIEKRSPVTAKHALGVIGAVFRHAIAHLQAETDPTVPLRGLIRTPRTKHKVALTSGQLRELFPKLRPPLQFLALTFPRPGELAGMQTEEIDGDLWTIPAERMKARRPHVIPLPAQARALLPFAPPSADTLNKWLKAAGAPEGVTAHSFRSTAATILPGMGYRSELIEHALAHVIGTATSRSYVHSTLVEERRAMLQVYADLITAPSNVITIGRAA